MLFGTSCSCILNIETHLFQHSKGLLTQDRKTNRQPNIFQHVHLTLAIRHALFLRRNHTYASSQRIGEYRIFVNILGRSRISWRVMARTDFHIEYLPIFVYSANLEVPRLNSAYLVHNEEYRECTNTLIRTLLVRLFSENVLGYSSRINVYVVPPLHWLHDAS